MDLDAVCEHFSLAHNHLQNALRLIEQLPVKIKISEAQNV